MSFDVFLYWFDSGQPQPIALSEVQRVFGKSIEAYGQGWSYQEDGQDISTIYWGDRHGPGLTDHITINRPGGDGRLFTFLIQLMALGNGVTFWPGCTRPAIVRAGAVTHLPEDFIEGLGAPTVVTRGSEILELIESS